MAELHADTAVESLGDGEVLLYGAHTGRSVVLGEETLAHLQKLPPVQQRLSRLGLLAGDDLLQRIVCRHRATLWLPDRQALWGPVPSQHGAGGHSYRQLPLDDDTWALWALINDRRTVDGLASALGRDAAEVLAMMRPLMHRDVQAIQLRQTAPRGVDVGLVRLVGPPREDHARSADQHGPHGETTLATYHLESVNQGDTHFDDRETTVAHAMALPHPGLRQRPYGQALREALGFDGPVVEVGCGTGELAAAWMSGGAVPYVRIDLSPELLRTQALAAPATAGVLGDATRLPLADGSVPFLLSNEVLADLESVPVAAAHPERQRMSLAYGLDPSGFANVGAWRMVEEVARVLAPGGLGVLTEFGVLEGPTEEAKQLDHPEVSIHFGELVQLALALGLRPEVVRLDQLLGIQLTAPQLSRISWMGVRARARAIGHHLKARAWVPQNLRLPFDVEGLHFSTLADEGPGPLVTRFYALLLRR